MRESYYDQLATSIEIGRASVLFKPLKDAALKNRHRELVDMIRMAGILSGSLWKQKTNIECFGFHGPFNIWNPDIEPHPTLLLDNDDESRNGDDVLHVVEPGIRAFGNSHGDNYPDSKIWSRCLVLVGDT